LAGSNSGLTLTVKKAMDIVDCLAAEGAPLSAVELSRKLGLSRSTAYRLLTTLRAGGYVTQDLASPEKYRLGYKILALAGTLLDNIELRQQALPLLEELRDFANETVHLVILERGQVVYIDKLECSQAVRMHSSIGRLGFMHSTAVGKAMAAFMPRETVTRILDQHGMPAPTSNTITDRAAFEQELDRVRAQGYALDNVENEEGIRCVAAPILSFGGKPVAAFSLSGPAFRMTLERAEALSEAVRLTAARISRQLGYLD
jgi:DNA-binding IclR family transcriptional regulator